MKKLLKNILRINNAKPLVQKSIFANEIHTNPKFYYKTFGNLHPDLLFYVIQRSPGAGFFSNFIFVLNHIEYAEKIGAIPIIDFKNFPNLYNESNDNSWEYYFKPLNHFNLNEIYNSKNVLISDSSWPKLFPTSITNETIILKIYKKYIKIDEQLINECENFFDYNFFNKKILGIHYRGKEQRIAASHPFPPTFKQIDNFIKFNQKNKTFDLIFIVTENLKNLNQFKKKYSKYLLFYDSARAKSNIYNLNPRNNHRYLLGKEILIEAILLSRCQIVLCGDSNVSEFSKLVSNKELVKFYQINNGYNSHNKIISKILWYIKLVLPKSLGGFDNNFFKQITK